LLVAGIEPRDTNEFLVALREAINLHARQDREAVPPTPLQVEFEKLRLVWLPRIKGLTGDISQYNTKILEDIGALINPPIS